MLGINIGGNKTEIIIKKERGVVRRSEAYWREGGQGDETERERESAGGGGGMNPLASREQSNTRTGHSQSHGK